MNCPRCGHGVGGQSFFCPQCGLRLDSVAQPPLAGHADSSQNSDAAPMVAVSPEGTEPVRARGCRSSLGVAGIAFLVVLVIGLIGLAAVYQGLQDRADIRVEAALQHLARGEVYMAEERYEMAVAEFEQALQLDPTLTEASSRLAEARALLLALPTPTSVLQGLTRETLWNELEASAAQQDWARAIQRADHLIAMDPLFRRDEVDQILYAALYQLGLEYVQADRLQEALRLFDRALALRPDSAQASLAQRLLKLYLDGMRYAGADWAAAVDRFSMVHVLDPGYRDVRARLHEAYLAYAEQLIGRDDWCLAALQYHRANELLPSDATQALAQQADERCGTPPVAATPAVPGTGAPAAPGPTAPSGTYVGRVQRTEPIHATSIYVRGQVLDRDGNGVPNVRVRIQAWDWFTYATADGSGQFSFDGLGNPVTYTLSLPDLPHQPVDAPTALAQLTWVVFEQAR